MASEMDPEEWLENLGEPIVFGPGERLTHPGDPAYHEHVDALFNERMVEHLRRFPRSVREAALAKLEALRDERPGDAS